MRNPDLHDALRGFALDAAHLLRDDQNHGAELDFDLDAGVGGKGPALYHYRPLTAGFIADRWERLRALASCERACEALGAGAAAYLRVNGLRGEDAEPALEAMLDRLYEDVTDFTFPEDRFERVYAEVERTLYERSQPATVLVAVRGLELEAERVELGDGIALVRGEHTDAPDEAVWGDPGDSGQEQRAANVLLTLTRDVSPDDPLPVADARRRFLTLLTGMRLWKAGGIALSALAWRRTGDGAWQAFEIEQTGVARGEPWILVDGEEAELCEFLDALGDATPGGRTAWALARFEMAAGRPSEAEALSDYLLALRALLDEGSEPGRSGLGLRVAALCAEDGERGRVRRRVELAQALERFIMREQEIRAGDVLGDGGDYMDAIGTDSPRTLVAEVERHLRALLRDVLCGFLDPDLRAIADDLLLDAAAPRQTSVAPATIAAVPDLEPEPEPELEPEPVAGLGPEIERIEESDEIEAAATRSRGGTADEQLAWDDWSAPV